MSVSAPVSPASDSEHGVAAADKICWAAGALGGSSHAPRVAGLATGRPILNRAGSPCFGCTRKAEHQHWEQQKIQWGEEKVKLQKDIELGRLATENKTLRDLNLKLMASAAEIAKEYQAKLDAVNRKRKTQSKRIEELTKEKDDALELAAAASKDGVRCREKLDALRAIVVRCFRSGAVKCETQ